jgi:hypothetical protein
MVKERDTVRAIRTWLNSLPGCWHTKVHGGPMSDAGVPDIVGVYRGRGFALEVKAPGRYASAAQRRELERVEAAGGIAAVVRSVEDAVRAIEAEHGGAR